MTCLTISLAGLWAQSTEHPIYEYHNVSVLRQVSPNQWAMEKDDGPFLFTACNDYDASKVIWPGYIMRKFRYQDMGPCGTIKRSDLGVWWQRDDNLDAVKILIKEN